MARIEESLIISYWTPYANIWMVDVQGGHILEFEQTFPCLHSWLSYYVLKWST